MKLLAEIAVFVGAAFGLGVAAGFGLWRAGRHPVPVATWRDTQVQLQRLQADEAQARAALTLAETEVLALQSHIARLGAVAERGAHEQATMDDKLRAARYEADRAGEERAYAVAEAEHLRRRLASLRISRERGE